MNKIYLVMVIVIILIIGIFGFRSYKASQIEKEFKKSITHLPQNMQKYMPLMDNKHFKQEVLVVYPTLFFYMDVKVFKDKQLPKEMQQKFQEEGDWMCKGFYSAIGVDLDRASNFERKTVLKFLKEEKIAVDLKLRNAFAEPLFHKTQILADCPEYYKALYND